MGKRRLRTSSKYSLILATFPPEKKMRADEIISKVQLRTETFIMSFED